MSNMKQRLIMEHVGPIDWCEIFLNKMTVFDGSQAAGKSTVAKAIFFFRTVKNELSNLFFSAKGWTDPVIVQTAQDFLTQKFYQFFDFEHFGEDSLLYFEYSPDVKIEISKKTGKFLENKILTWDNQPVKFSDKIIEWLLKQAEDSVNERTKIDLERELSDLFSDDKEIVYIPAGRSMLSILSEALSHIFFHFDDDDKNLIDYCTTDYLSRVTKIKPQFKLTEGQYRYNFFKTDNDEFNPEFVMLIYEKIGRILKGRYKYADGKEFLDVAGKEIKIKFASSGQQEVLWILNLIFYYLQRNKKACFIIEELEAHLYPNSQKDVTEFIALSLAYGNECIITTHSPYILGTLNNLTDARRLFDEGYNITRLLEEEQLTIKQLIGKENLSAYFFSNRAVQDATDKENGLIRNEMIDDASDRINDFADALFEIERGGKL